MGTLISSAPLPFTTTWSPSAAIDARFTEVTVPDPGGRHFLRFVGVVLAMTLASVFGIFWSMHAHARTGYRKRDVLLSMVPVLGVGVWARTMWRYTARDVYWDPRSDRASATMEPANLKWAVRIGFAGFLLWLVVAPPVVARLDETIARTELEQSTVWTDDVRTLWVEMLEKQGLEMGTAYCFVGYIEAQYPVGPPDLSDPALEQLGFEAATACAPLR